MPPRTKNVASMAVIPSDSVPIWPEQKRPRRKFAYIATGLAAPFVLCILLRPAVAQQQGNIYGDPWQNVPWHGVTNWPNMQYRWIGGGTYGQANIYSGCKLQIRTTDGTQPTVPLNLYYADGDFPAADPNWLHLSHVTVGPNGAYAANPAAEGKLSNLESGSGCLGVTRVEVNANKPQ